MNWTKTKPDQFDLIRPDGSSAATVWSNGVWHTWDHDGCGGENSAEANVAEALYEAETSAIFQGFYRAQKRQEGEGE